MSQIKLSDYIFDWLYKIGVKHIFLLSGGGCIHLIDSVGKSKIKYICNLHEQACAMAAEGYSRITGNIGACLVTTGPGSTNTLTGLIGAWLDSIPVIFISGQVKTEIIADYTKLRQIGDQEVNIIDMVKPVTKYAITITNPSEIKYHLEKAYFLAKNGRPGPVWLNIPLDIQGSIIQTNKLKSFHQKEITIPYKTDSKLLKKLVKQTLDKISKSKRPVLYVGNGVRLSGAAIQLLHLINLLKIPVLNAFLGYDLVSPYNKYYRGRPGIFGQRAANFTFQNSDLLLILGSRMDIYAIGHNFSSVARSAYKIMVDIDKEELFKNTFIPNLKINYDVKEFIKEMLIQLTDKFKLPTYDNWLNIAKNWMLKYPVVKPEYWKEKKYVNPYCFIANISKYITANDKMALTNGSALICDYQALNFPQRTRVIINAGCASMGYGLPAAIGICFANNKKRTICIENDGSIQMCLQELQTVLNHKLPIKIFVLNNQGYLSIRQTQDNLFQGRKTASCSKSGVILPDMTKIAKAYGFRTEKIRTHKSMDQIINKVFNYDGPVFCEVMVSPTFPFSPKAASKKLSNGKFVSRPLEDMMPFLTKDELKENMLIPLWED